MSQLVRLAACICLLCGLSGCVTLLRTHPGELEADNKVYIGTREWACVLDPRTVEPGRVSDRLICFVPMTLDLPLCLVADTLLLPYTVPWTLSKRAEQKRAASTEVPKTGM